MCVRSTAGAHRLLPAGPRSARYERRTSSGECSGALAHAASPQRAQVP
jgi:hypothetical protein